MEKVKLFDWNIKSFYFMFSDVIHKTTRQFNSILTWILPGIYEIFCKETFGVKTKNLEFGLQPHKIPDTETVC